jgi:hypothetical protein
MIEDELLGLLERALKPLGCDAVVGEHYLDPSLSVLRWYGRKLHLGGLPILGRASSVVAVVRQPVEIPFTTSGNRQLLERIAIITNDRFPSWPRGWGFSIGLTAVVLTSEPIGPTDDATLRESLALHARFRAVPLGHIRLNLGQEAMALALAEGPSKLFTEPATVADALAFNFRRYVPLLEG